MPKKLKKKRLTPVTVEIVPSEEIHEAPVEPKEELTEPLPTPPEEEKIPEVDPQLPTPEPAKEKTHIGVGFFVIVMVIALFVALFSGALYVYFTGVSQLVRPSATPNSAAQTPEPQISFDASPTPAASAKPTTAPKLTDLKISVLNGSGKIGEANKVKAMLEKAGFKVTQTGNANSFDFTDTTIAAKSTVSADVITSLKDALKNYTLKDGTALDAKNTFDIIVTVGSK